MGENIKISVIIPVYNGEKTLENCLNSVVNQTYKNYEIVVVDNNSKDDTKNIIKSLQKINKKIKCVFGDKIGRGHARNLGIDNSSGEIIAMTDSDCIVTNNWLEKISKFIIKGTEDAVMGSYENGSCNYWTENIKKSEQNHYKNNSNGKYINLIDTKNFAIRTDLIKKIMFDGYFDRAEDIELYLRLKNITKIRFIPDIKVEHLYNGSVLKYFSLQANRAYWTFKVYLKYKKSNLKNEVAFRSFSFIWFLSVMPFLIKKAIKKPDEFIFYLISEISWGLGIIRGIIF